MLEKTIVMRLFYSEMGNYKKSIHSLPRSEEPIERITFCEYRVSVSNKKEALSVPIILLKDILKFL